MTPTQIEEASKLLEERSALKELQHRVQRASVYGPVEERPRASLRWDDGVPTVYFDKDWTIGILGTRLQHIEDRLKTLGVVL
jgi:hypothetical protein